MTRSGTRRSINSFLRPDTLAFLARSSCQSCGRVHDSYLSDIPKSFRQDIECTLPAMQRLSWLARHLSTICATANPISSNSNTVCLMSSCILQLMYFMLFVVCLMYIYLLYYALCCALYICSLLCILCIPCTVLCSLLCS